jgi:N,N'-diacetyllegionaminate synthase
MHSNFFNNGKKTYLIAEIGVNHNGSVQIAKKLIKIAKKIGMDAVKFQSFKAEKLSSTTTKLTEYQKKNLIKQVSHFDMLKKLELSENDQKQLFLFCKKIKIEFISTPFDVHSAKFLNKLGIKYFKTASPDLHDVYLHEYLSKLNKKIIISTGMSNEKEIKNCLSFYKKKNKIALLHCVSSYPCNYKSVNMKALNILKKYSNTIGFSDHTLDSLSAITAVSLGSKIIEKHFTLNKNMEGPDHRFSLDPNEMKIFKETIRNTEIILGEEIKKCQSDEKKNKKITIKSIVAKKNIKRGSRVTKDDFTLTRMGKGLTGFYLKKIINKYSKNQIKSGSLIKKSFF